MRNISVCKTRLRYTRMNAEEKKRQLKAGDEMNSLVLQMQTSDTPNDSKLDCVRFFFVVHFQFVSLEVALPFLIL